MAIIERMTRMARGLAVIAVCMAAAMLGPSAAQAQQGAAAAGARGPTVTDIVVLGNQRIEPATVISYLTLKVGDPISEAALNQSVRQLYDTGLFRDAAVAVDGGKLLVQVAENPSINRINFEGNDLISDEQMLAIISSRPRRSFTRAQAEADAQALIDNYRATGRYGAVVEPVIIELPENRVDLVFEISEGDVTEIYRIDFVGNEQFSDGRLRGVIDTSESGFLGFILNSDVYDPDRLEFDKQLLRRFYLSQGFADFTVLSAVAELAPDREGFYITFTVEEGELYTFGEFEVINSAPALDPEDFQALIPEGLTGQTYDATQVEAIIEDMVYLAGQQGFAFMDVRPRARRNEAERTIDVAFELVEGPRVYVERIDIEGNDRTLDRVIRRQFEIVEGDAFNARAVEQARGRIRALGFFADVDVRTERGATDDRAVIKVEVEEQSTGSINFGLGFSSAVGPTGEISIQEANFLGRGQFARARVRVAEDSQIVDFTFEEPAFLDRDLRLGLNAFYRDEDLDDESSYEITSIGFIPSIAFPVSEPGRLRLFYEISNDDIRDLDDNVSPLIQRDEGDKLTSAIGFRYTHDLRDDPIETTSGYFLTFEQTFAGLGGDAQYSRSVVSAKGWTSFFADDVIASIELEGGAVYSTRKDLEVNERFFIGGDSLRGFAYGGIGPRDQSLGVDGKKRDDALGGDFYAVGRAEVSFPVGLPEEFGIHGGLFADVGTLWGLDDNSARDTNVDSASNGLDITVDDSAHLRAAVGASIFWDSGFGPLRLNFAIPVKKQSGDETEFFRLTVGTRF
ncbi:outer membrane protein assembly factor BamA [Pikeienuella piscinae]|uniref:Outer membrane protein assembly factor BamA n=1 Tax=Pikeienuella piscinae TaxID=2748098 RepID=A0A7L5BUU7_9RHOB|nr:outer membrane protein assembly factor BamA [Pikeienuella piscinae]QIE56080.1 outer membrane protein assembly factor BamA [Pikeienuella piscinae]